MKVLNNVMLFRGKMWMSLSSSAAHATGWTVYSNTHLSRSNNYCSSSRSITDDQSFSVVSFYKLKHLDNPQQIVGSLATLLADLHAKGRIYINRVGVNAQMCLPRKNVSTVSEFFAQVYGDNIHYNVHATDFQVFNRLRIRHGKLLEGMDENFDPEHCERGTAVSPQTWDKMLTENSENTTILDVRNDYEWEVGHFKGSLNSKLRQFSEFKDYASKISSEFDKESKVLMYCTGGIRCELFSSMLKENGMKHIYQLQGGILNYGRHSTSDGGGLHWQGRVFVFDDRLVVPLHGRTNDDDDKSDLISVCRFCGKSTDCCYNCAGHTCNNVFMACDSCAAKHMTCCSVECAATGNFTFRRRNYKQINLNKTVGRGEHFRQVLSKLPKANC